MTRLQRLLIALLLLCLPSTALAAGSNRWTNWARRAWSPQDMALAAWYRADRGITIATGVSQWADQSGNGRNLAQATTNKQPSFDASGGPSSRATVIGDGFNDTLKVTGGFTLAQPETVILVAKWVGAYVANDDLCDGNTGNTMRFRRNSGSHQLVMTGSNDLGASTFADETLFHWYTLFFGGASSTVKQDGTTKIGPGNAGTASPGGLQLFTFGDGASDPANAAISEVLVLSRALTSDEESRINFYMHADYGL